MKQIAHSIRRWVLFGMIVLCTVLFSENLFYKYDTQGAFINFLTACVCWVGIYFINMSEQIELEQRKKESGEEYDDDE